MKKRIIVIDTETACTKGKQLIFDIGYIVTDKNGSCYTSKSFVIKEIFCNRVAMSNAFYSNKIPFYIEDISSGKRTLASFKDAINALWDDIEKYRVKEVAAYNLPFDLRALANTEDALYQTSVIIDDILAPLEKHDIMRTACETLYKKRYADFCKEHGLYTEHGNLQTGAEAGYKFITKDPNFEERHMAIEDVTIEVEILKKVYKTKKKLNKAPKGGMWKIPQKYL